ncbi:hypothetical protein [Qipengyuania flava]|uniref:hypothetical protein n=1 Tax=Qipengyuania flava TaxID=192812 RepID=UPI001C62A231|nr:hypothetical protein [Qipengyuania flava]QYJ07963.1 hypothetical protein KUV82_04450 [Qipengyuania flava]
MDQHDPAKARFFAIQGVRLSGVIMGILGALVLGEILPFPPVVGYILLAIAAAEIFILPLVLAKRWRTPE